MKNGQAVAVRRDDGTKESIEVTADVGEAIAKMLDKIQSEMFQKAKKLLDENVAQVESWNDFLDALENKKLLFVPFCGEVKCEEEIKALSKKYAKLFIFCTFLTKHMRSNFFLIALEMKIKMPKDQAWGQRVYAFHSNNQANL